MAMLSTPFRLQQLELNNRIVMAPMCQYSVEAKDGKPNDWHFVHYVSRAVGGAGLILMEMTDVEPDGRISDYDLGLWSDDHIPAFRRIIDEVHKYGAKIGIQIAHAGRKAEDAAVPVAPSGIAVTDRAKQPRALTNAEVKGLVAKFRDAARRAVAAGVDTIELHGAHGYLIHQFHSPAINRRDDEYGEKPELFGTEIIHAVKEVMPQGMPLLLRISAMEYMDGGYDLDYALRVGEAYRDAGVDMFHVSSGGEGPAAGVRKPGNYPGYQVPMARAFKQTLGVPVIAVGMLDDPQLAEATLANGDADLVAVARGMLRDPYWALHAIRAVGSAATPPRQYERAF
jgi:2,4-dienoyl-CoA reductase-like NADH-dependent reductase (Old Yellow Enzyme family)